MEDIAIGGQNAGAAFPFRQQWKSTATTIAPVRALQLEVATSALSILETYSNFATSLSAIYQIVATQVGT